jgi:hypothetical protein
MRYRIIKKHYRSGDFEVKHYYIIQYLGRSIFFRPKWKPVKKYYYDSMGGCKDTADFDTLDEAMTAVRRLKEAVPPDSKIYL